MGGVRGRPFQPGNKFGRGRPEGSRNKSTIALQGILDHHGEAILKKAVFLTLQGDKAAMRLCIERLLPVRRHHPIRFRLPKIESVTDVAKASAGVLRAVVEGKLTDAQGAMFTSMLEQARHAFEAASLEERIRTLERNQSKGSPDDHPSA